MDTGRRRSRACPVNLVFVDETRKIGLIPFAILCMVRLSAVAVTFGSSTIEGKGQTMGFRNLAKAAAESPIHDKHKAAVKKALEERKEELEEALAAVKEGLRHLRRRAKKR
jgi:hypothetical protein